MQWVIYPLAALMILETFVFKSGGPGPSPYAVAGRAMLLAMLAMFSLILLAFFLHLLGSLRRPHASAGLGGAHIVLRSPVWGLRVALIALVLGNLAALALIPDLPAAWADGFGLAAAWPDLGPEMQAMILFFSAVALFLLLAFAQRAVLNPPWFVLTREGFLYEPGGVSPGLIRWRDVRDMKEDAVLAGSNTYNGPRLDPVLVVTLSDYEKYLAAYNPLLRFLIRHGTRLLRYQTRGGDIYLNPSDFGARYAEVKAAMLAHWREAVPERA